MWNRLIFSLLCGLAISTAVALGQATQRGARPVSQPTSKSSSRPSTTQAASRPASQNAVPDPLASPRATMRTFLLALNEAKDKPARINDAIACLDLSKISDADRVTLAPKLAEQLGAVIQAIGVQTDVIPDTTEGKPYVFSSAKGQKILMSLGADHRWRFTPETVAQVPAMYADVRKAAMAEPPKRTTSVDAAYGTPRATMQTFLAAAEKGDFTEASKCLDLGDLPAGARAEAGQSLAQKLKATMGRIRAVIFQEIPADADGDVYAWYVGSEGRIELERQPSGPRQGQWLFSKSTVKNMEGLYREMSKAAQADGTASVKFWDAPGLWLREHAPDSLKGHSFLLLEWYQWLFLCLVAAAALAIKPLIVMVLQGIAHLWLRRRQVALESAFVARNLRPAATLLILGLWWWGLRLLDLDIRVQQVLWPPFKFCSAIIGIWASYRLISLISGYYDQRLTTMSGSTVFPMLVPLISKTLKVIVLACGAVIILRTLDQDVGALLTGLGLGGLAFALAAQDTLKNFFGSLTLLGDRPFRVGDYVKINIVEGIVERVGLRSTRIRTFYDSIVTVPNAELTNSIIDNMGVRRWRRFREVIGLTYETPIEKLQAFRDAVRDAVCEHPHVRKDIVHVRITALNASSIDVLVQCLIEASEYADEIAFREQLIFDIIRIARRLGVEFAFPTQSLHVESLPERSPRRPQAAARSSRSPLAVGSYEP